MLTIPNDSGQQLLSWLLFANPLYGFGSLIDSNSVPFSGGIINSTGGRMLLLGSEIKPLVFNIVFYLIASVVFLCLAIRRIMPVKKPLFSKGRDL